MVQACHSLTQLYLKMSARVESTYLCILCQYNHSPHELSCPLEKLQWQIILLHSDSEQCVGATQNAMQGLNAKRKCNGENEAFLHCFVLFTIFLTPYVTTPFIINNAISAPRQQKFCNVDKMIKEQCDLAWCREVREHT